MNESALTTLSINWPRPICELEIVKPNMFTIQFTVKKPNWWYRMWYKLLLGWTWKDLK